MLQARLRPARNKKHDTSTRARNPKKAIAEAGVVAAAWNVTAQYWSGHAPATHAPLGTCILVGGALLRKQKRRRRDGVLQAQREVPEAALAAVREGLVQAQAQARDAPQRRLIGDAPPQPPAPVHAALNLKEYKVSVKIEWLYRTGLNGAGDCCTLALN